MSQHATWREWDELGLQDRADLLKQAGFDPWQRSRPWRALPADVRMRLIERSVSLSKSMQVLDCDLGGRVRSNAWSA